MVARAFSLATLDQLVGLERLALERPVGSFEPPAQAPPALRLQVREIVLIPATRHQLASRAVHGGAALESLRRDGRAPGLAAILIDPARIAERCLNHAQPGIIATYDTHQYLDEKRNALTQWADHLQAPL